MEKMDANVIFRLVHQATDDLDLANKIQNQWLLNEAELNKG